MIQTVTAGNKKGVLPNGRTPFPITFDQPGSPSSEMVILIVQIEISVLQNQCIFQIIHGSIRVLNLYLLNALNVALRYLSKKIVVKLSAHIVALKY